MAATYETALCIIPPKPQWSSVDRLRALYDKAYGKWPPHVNIIYPFVSINNLDKAASQVQAGLDKWRSASERGSVHLRVRLDSAGFFAHRDARNTLYLSDGSLPGPRSDGDSLASDLPEPSLSWG